MARIRRLSHLAVKMLFTSGFALLLSACITCVDCKKECGGEPDDPNRCTNIAVDVTVPNQPAGCIVNPGVSKRCSMTNYKCPTASGPKTCQTIVGAGGNCSCACP